MYQGSEEILVLPGDWSSLYGHQVHSGVGLVPDRVMPSTAMELVAFTVFHIYTEVSGVQGKLFFVGPLVPGAM